MTGLHHTAGPGTPAPPGPDGVDVARVAGGMRADIDRLRIAVRSLDDPAAAVVVASLGRASLDRLRAILASAGTAADPVPLDAFADELDADAAARLHGWIQARLDVDALLRELAAAANRLAG